MTDTAPSSKVIAPTVAELPASAAERFGERVAARYKDGEQWKEITFAQAGEAIGDREERERPGEEATLEDAPRR